MPEITFHVDTAADRLIRDQLSTFVTGSITPPYGDPVDGWVTLSNTWVDPIKKVLMLAPMRMLPAWHTTTSGIYARLGKASFTLSETAKWNDVQNKLAGDTWIAGEDLSSNSSGITTGTYAKNRGWYVSWFAFNALDDDQFIQFECGWNSSVSGASGVSLRFYSSGGVEVWKDGSQVGSGSIAGSRANQQNADRAVSVLIIPYNRRELLIVSNQGDGFVHTFEDIAEDDANPTIVGATNFWFRLPEGGTSQLQLAPLQFPTSGYAMGIKSVFKAPPGSGETAYHESFSVGAFYGTQSVSTSLVEVGLPGTAFTPDGTKQEAQIKATFTGDGISTSFVSGARSWFLPLTDAVAGTEADITDYVGSASFEYGILAANSQANITLLDYDAAEAALTLSGLLTMSNRPWEIRHDTTNTIFAGANDPPTYIRKVNAETETLTLSIRSIWKQLETFRFDDALPLDGYTLAEAFEAILTAAGLTASQYTISASTLSLGYGGSPSMGEFGLEVLPGDTAAEWIDRLHQDFCATWFIGIGIETGYPVINILSPADMESTPAQTIYMSREAAITATADPDMAIVYHDGWEEFRLEPEANEIWVTGYDPRSRRPIIVYYTDANSADPTITPALRPTNWLGEKRKYALIDPAITTIALAQEAAETLANRLTPNRVIATARGPMWLDGSGIPLVRGRLVTVDGIDWRIQSVRVVSRRETSTWQYRECEYLLERNEEAYPAGGRLAVIGQTARQIADFVKAGRRLWPVRVLRRGGDKLKGLPIEVLNLP